MKEAIGAHQEELVKVYSKWPAAWSCTNTGTASIAVNPACFTVQTMLTMFHLVA